MIGWQPQRKNNWWLPGIAAISIHILLGFLLISGLAVDVVRKANSAIKVTNIMPDPPPPELMPPQQKIEVIKKAEPQGAASSKNIKSKAAPREAPVSKLKLLPSNSKPISEKADAGNDNTAGNSNQIGPGTGAGSQRAGTSAGTGGDGNGGGAVQTRIRAKYISGRIKNSDYPRAASIAKALGTVMVKFKITANGRAVQCRVIQSSGNADLDATTCRLIEKRFRYEPARDTNGNAIDDVTGWKQDWWFDTSK